MAEVPKHQGLTVTLVYSAQDILERVFRSTRFYCGVDHADLFHTVGTVDSHVRHECTRVYRYGMITRIPVLVYWLP